MTPQISHRYNFDRTRIVRADVIRFKKPATILDEKERKLHWRAEVRDRSTYLLFGHFKLWCPGVPFIGLAIRDTGFDKIRFSCVISQSGFTIKRTPSRLQGLSWTGRGCPCTLSSCVIANSCSE
ncbi:hypothetical protein CDEST_04978 [Colletotrichum destructivum]|uniref:Transposase n=1 Tax=Colletotrichum destructivum TaxID=34406 RepID=A0AAX4I9I8_9PEZI|nr:hypothetical protein CDEST_04978 [Colletotrichum destructivum]